MSRKQTIGVLPKKPITGEKFATVFCTCVGCGTRIVPARDDRFPEAEVINLVNEEPDGGGHVVLWYEVSTKGKPFANADQWFRMLDPSSDWSGARWSIHVCPQLTVRGAA